jgi:hypothetical protein
MDDTSMFSINNQYKRFLKILSIIDFFLVLVVLTIIVRVGPASSYEFSIYDAFPGYFWIFFLSAIFCGQLIIIGSTFTQSKNNYWLFGFSAILISIALLLFMPIIRGYYIYGDADVLTHIGYMKDILRTSSISGDHYPIDHILGVSIHVISGLSFPDITLIIPPFFSFFFILSMYFVGKTILLNKFEQLILVVLASILLLGNNHLSFVPNSQALSLVPLILFLAFKMYQGVNNQKYSFLLLLISFLIVFYHPLVTVMVIVILCVMQIMQYILEKYDNRILKKVNYTYVIFFIIAVFSMWSTYLMMATKVIQPIIERIFGDEKIKSELQKNIDVISQVNIDPVYLLKLIFNIYGNWILLGILSLLCIGIILKSIKNQKTKPDFYKGVIVMGFLVFLMLSMFMFFTNGRFGFGRIYVPAIIFSLLLIPIGISLFLYNNHNEKSLASKKKIILLGIIFVFFAVTYFSTFNLYISPIIKETNIQSPKSDHIGMSTFFSYRDESLPVLDFGLDSYRFYDAIFGHSAARMNIGFRYHGVALPDHFGYQNETLSKNFYNNSKYLLVNDRGRGFYPQIYPEFQNKWRFTAEDFERINFDTKIQQVYSNRNLEIFVISKERRIVN